MTTICRSGSVTFFLSGVAKPGAMVVLGGVAPLVEETRPLSRRSCDAKLVTAVGARSMKPSQKEHAVRTICGFVSERQFVSHPIALDDEARMHPWNPLSTAILLFHDFMSAISSIAHAWLMIALEYIEPPRVVSSTRVGPI